MTKDRKPPTQQELAERVAQVWEITRKGWLFHGGDPEALKFRKDVGRVVRR